MPVYRVTTKGSDNPRLVEATSAQAAINHASAGMFVAERITKPADLGRLMAGGATLETAGEAAPQDPPAEDPPANDPPAGDSPAGDPPAGQEADDKAGKPKK